MSAKQVFLHTALRLLLLVLLERIHEHLGIVRRDLEKLGRERRVPELVQPALDVEVKDRVLVRLLLQRSHAVDKDGLGSLRKRDVSGSSASAHQR